MLVGAIGFFQFGKILNHVIVSLTGLVLRSRIGLMEPHLWCVCMQEWLGLGYDN